MYMSLFPKSLIAIILLNISISAQYQNIRVSSTSSTDPNETSIAINPIEPDNLVAGANIRYYYYSTNGGLNWTQGNLSSTYGVWGDPCVVFDVNGHVYFGHLSNPGSPGYWIDRIVVQKSTNKGVSWSNGVGIGYNPPTRNQDKEWLAVDWTNSPYRNNIYMAWTEFDSYGSSNPLDSTRILFSRSTDGGITWSAPVRISEKGGDCIDEDNTVEGAVPAVGPNGEVYLSWAGPLGLVFDKSTDGGASWGNDKIITSIPGGWDFAVPGIYRCNGLPITACDISNSPYRGNIYINWSDQRNGTNNTDVFIVKSTDGGNTWTPPKKVSNEIGSSHQFFTWISVDPGTGIVYVVYYDRRNYSDNRTDVYISRSTDGGETFTDIKISQSPFTPTSSIFFGDYTNIAAFNGKVYPIWTRLESGQRSVWMAIIQDSLPNQVTANFSTSAGWNLLSVPIQFGNNHVNQVFPGAISNAYSFENGYIAKDTLKVGNGYWLKFVSPQNHKLVGTLVSSVNVPVREGWNLIGSLNGSIPVSSITTTPPGIIVSPFFEYAGGYQQSNLIDKGKGYWVKSSSNGSLNLTISSFKSSNEVRTLDYDKFARLIVSDISNSSALFISNSIIDLSIYELPPMPPSGIFDVRFEDDRNVMLSSEKKIVKLNGVEFPITLKFVDNSHQKDLIRLNFADGSTFELHDGESMVFDNPRKSIFQIEVVSSIGEKILSQNYPNPFNGATKINFILKRSSESNGEIFTVSLRIFDILGRRSATLINGRLESGFHSVEFDPSKFALTSGIYFYELVAIEGSTGIVSREIKKMNYLK